MVLCATCSSVSRLVMYILAMRGPPFWMPNEFYHITDTVIGSVVVGFSLKRG